MGSHTRCVNGLRLKVNPATMPCMAKVGYTPWAAKGLASLPRPIMARVLAIVDRLGDWPTVSGAKLLRGKLAGHWRIRTGGYRVVFRVIGDYVEIVAIDNRRDVYE